MLVINDLSELTPIIATAVAETLAAIRADEDRLKNHLAYAQAEAARTIGMQPHALRDARLRGEIGFSKGPGGKVYFTRDDLLKFLARNRTEARV